MSICAPFVLTARRLSVLSLLVALLATSCQPTAVARGLVIVDAANSERPNFHDFGEVPHGQHVEHTWVLLNTDPVPVTIRDLLSGCSCTVPSIHYVDVEGSLVEGNVRARGEVLTVPPGAKVYINMSVDSTEVGVMNRDKLSMVRLRCDSVNTAFMNFEMHLVVRQLFQATPKTVSIGQVAQSVGGSGFSEIVAAVKEGSPRIVDIESSDPQVQVNLTESVRYGVTLWTLTAKVPPDLPLGPYRSKVLMRTTDSQGEGNSGRFQVELSAQIVDDVLCDPPTAALGSFSRDKGRTIETRVRTLVPGHRINLTGYELTGTGSEELQFSLAPITPDEAGRAKEWIATLTVPAGASLDFYSGLILLKLDDPQYPTLRVPYSGRVEAVQ